MEYGAYIDRVLAMDYDAAVVEWKADGRSDAVLRPVPAAAGYNFIGYSNPRVDGLIQQARERDMNRAKGDAQRDLPHQPYTFIAVPQELTGVDDRAQ